MSNPPSPKVIGLGLPRTGTASLRLALLTLGYAPCHHMQTEVLSESIPYRKGRTWHRIFNTRDPTTRQALIKSIMDEGGFNSSVDFPPSLFVEDLLELYPDAKFILSVRKNAEVWRQSFNETLGLTRTWWFHYASWLLPSRRISIEPLEYDWDAMNAELYEGAQIYETDSVEVYDGHNLRVTRFVPRDRLLMHEASQGWGPICEFLGVEVPREPYPRVNEKGKIKRWFYTGAGVGVVVWCFWVGVVVGVVKYSGISI